MKFSSDQLQAALSKYTFKGCPYCEEETLHSLPSGRLTGQGPGHNRVSVELVRDAIGWLIYITYKCPLSDKEWTEVVDLQSFIS